MPKAGKVKEPAAAAATGADTGSNEPPRKKRRRTKQKTSLDASHFQDGFVVDTTPTRPTVKQAWQGDAPVHAPIELDPNEISSESDVPASENESGEIQSDAEAASPAALSLEEPTAVPSAVASTQSEDAEGDADLPVPGELTMLQDLELEAGPEELSMLQELTAHDEAAAASRYYAAGPDPTHTCSLCGEVGHSIRQCTHTQCTTCGEIDTHEFRQCPVNRACKRCGAKGHYEIDCPARFSHREGRCERCGSTVHKSTACPSIWRRYIEAPELPPRTTPLIYACYNCGEDSGPQGHFGYAISSYAAIIPAHTASVLNVLNREDIR